MLLESLKSATTELIQLILGLLKQETFLKRRIHLGD